MMGARLVEDPRGGVILTGGYTGLRITSLYRLKHAGAQWKLMTQQLKYGNNCHVAFIIPDSFAPNCTLN